jgi:hypothetical protein
MIKQCPPMSQNQITECNSDTTLRGQPARQICKAINDNSKSDETRRVVKDILNSFNPLNVLKSSAKSKSKIINELSTKIDTKDFLEQYNKCDQLTTQQQSNVIKGMSSDCIKALTTGDLFSKEDIQKMQKNSTMSDIVQQNVANAATSCKADLVMKALTECTASIDNSALQSALNSAKGMMSDSSSDQENCNNISLDMSACKYLQQNQCCAQQTSQVQSNLLQAGCEVGQINNIVQSNNANALSSCILSSQTSVTTEMASNIKNTVSQAAENKSEGLTMGFFIILVVIFFVIVGSPLILSKIIGTLFFEYIGPILSLVGVVCIIIWAVFTRKPEVTKYNDPFYTYQGVKYLDQLAPSTFGEVKARVKKDDVMGYDFYIDAGDDGWGNSKSPKDPTKIADDQTGSVAYVTVMPKSDAAHTSFDKSKSSAVTYIKATENIKLKFVGCGLVIAGVIVFIFSMIKNTNVMTETGKIEETLTN